ncbi:MAG: two-component system, OmpR family, sensor histidine kinase MtrB [Ilumatobacteraceae bacterium]|nr:two-component system, OmpR family, sensor histidine kinase MtrB [Ilumatobacteraceae bacterium]
MPVARRRQRSLRLRTRVTLFFSLTALVASLALAVVTYGVARNFLVDQRTKVIEAQAISNATLVQRTLLVPPAPGKDALSTLIVSLKRSGEGFAFLNVADVGEFLNDARFQRSSFPPELMGAVVAQGGAATQRFSFGGEPYMAVGINIPSAHAQYYEAVPLSDTDTALRSISTALLIGAAVTTIFAGALGWSTSRRLLRPISRVSTAAGEIASGGLDTRMAPEADPDLALLVKSFNEMADAVQTRFEREARFASDVSHELRSPITALTAAVEVLDARRADLPERSQQALDVVVGQVRRFDQMVMDLLELSRIDAGSTEMLREEVDIEELVSRIAHRYGFGDTPIEIDPKVPRTVRIDKLRFERILANLLDNAREHAGGPTRVRVEPHARHGIALAVDDAGPGVARGERARIFERFARGSAARHRVGTGLGLALVAEHAHAHGGEAWVEDRPGGGARFKVSLAEVL